MTAEMNAAKSYFFQKNHDKIIWNRKIHVQILDSSQKTAYLHKMYIRKQRQTDAWKYDSPTSAANQWRFQTIVHFALQCENSTLALFIKKESIARIQCWFANVHALITNEWFGLTHKLCVNVIKILRWTKCTVVYSEFLKRYTTDRRAKVGILAVPGSST